MHVRPRLRLRLLRRLSVTVRVDELSSDVTVEAERVGKAASGAETETPAPADQLRALLAQLARDAARTQSEAFSD